ncbi:DUF559 domain-containing protein [Prescottella agglutinans]|uniref:Very-short-patch-repair endonuclease n=1 Tax=Prescottella agglutinans TaxID=1644129 RepID=A0ABT6M7M9_9NOCA|nr:DUF559 domain-containing protein [Prescottella agglutinans]MDH6279429.1 very-short-patch-repair endonuclease [Prescottella agglutinans]
MNPFGIHTFDELLDAGIPRSTIGSRCRSGRYHRVLPRIYAVTEPTTLALCHAVTRWQPTAVLSHRTAAWLHGWTGEPDVVEATVPPRVRVRTPKWLLLHRRNLDDAHVGESWSLPTVSAGQTLIDCGAVMSVEEYERLVDAQLTRSVTPDELRALRDGHPGRWGNTTADAQLRTAAVRAASEPERLLARALNRRRCPMAANEPVGPYVCDFVDARAKVVVEVDGREFHSAPDVFRSDRRRQNWLVRQGWLVLRYAAYDVLTDPDSVAEEIVAIVRRRRHNRRRSA